MPEVASPYNLNLGEIHAGDWPSSVPTTATMRLRIGFPRAWTPDDAEREVRAAVAAIVDADGRVPLRTPHSAQRIPRQRVPPGARRIPSSWT